MIVGGVDRETGTRIGIAQLAKQAVIRGPVSWISFVSYMV
jgi:hypothetical protein